MITGIDHVGIYVRDLERAAADITILLGRAAEWRGAIGDHRHAWFQLGNMALDLIAPEGNSDGAQKTHAYMDKHGEGIWGLGFAVSDLERASALLIRRGLDVLPAAVTRSLNEGGGTRDWRIAMIRRASTGGATLFLVQQEAARISILDAPDDTVSAVDHIVINTTDPERATALYGARLGLDLRLDRSNAQWGARLQFFRCGSATVEIASKLGEASNSNPDSFGGLAFRVGNAEEAHARLTRSGFEVSALRPGRKPGTGVFTVRSRTADVPTLMLEAQERPNRKSSFTQN